MWAAINVWLNHSLSPNPNFRITKLQPMYQSWKDTRSGTALSAKVWTHLAILWYEIQFWWRCVPLITTTRCPIMHDSLWLHHSYPNTGWSGETCPFNPPFLQLFDTFWELWLGWMVCQSRFGSSKKLGKRRTNTFAFEESEGKREAQSENNARFKFRTGSGKKDWENLQSVVWRKSKEWLRQLLQTIMIYDSFDV